MTVLFSKKCEIALQACLFLSIQERNTCFSADFISENLNIPKEFTSKVLQSLEKFKIVGSKKGKSGGFFLLKPPSEITLLNIVESVDGLEVFDKCVLGFPNCNPNSPCPVHNRWGKIRDEALKMLAEDTLEDLLDATNKKIKKL